MRRINLVVSAAPAFTLSAAPAATRPALGVSCGDLPAGCAYAPVGSAPFHSCGAYGLAPADGANGVYYRVVVAP